MVFRKEMLVVFISIMVVLWIQTTSMRPNASKKKLLQEDDKEQEMLFQCYDAINCELGPEFYDEMDNECYNITIPQDVELLVKFIRKAGHDFDAVDFDALLGFFCPKEKDTKREIFELASNKLVAHVSEACAALKEKECERLQAFLKCLGTILHKHNEAGDC